VELSVIDIPDAEARLPNLIQRVEDGEEVILGRFGQPAARLIPVPGELDLDSVPVEKGEIWMDPDCGSVESFGFAVCGGPGAS
jgi:prevent-host-death family protein